MTKRTKKNKSLIEHHYEDHPHKETRDLASTEEGCRVILNYFKKHKVLNQIKKGDEINYEN